MDEELPLRPPQTLPSPAEPEAATQGMSSMYKMFEAFIALREKNEREHRFFDQSLKGARDTLVEKFNGFAGETQRAFQNLRQELTGEKRIALATLSELLEIAFELEHIVAAKPVLPEEKNGALPEVRKWIESVEVQCRRIQAALERHGVFPYDAVVGAPYNPALHERVGSTRMEGMDALRVAEQKEHGFASQHHEFVLRRPKVIVTE